METLESYIHFDSLNTAMVYEIRGRALCGGDVYGFWTNPFQFLSYCTTLDGLNMVSTSVGKIVLQ